MCKLLEVAVFFTIIVQYTESVSPSFSEGEQCFESFAIATNQSASKIDEVDAEGEDCSVVINELNSNDPVKPERKEFIELVSFCNGYKKEHTLQGHKLIVLTTGTGNAIRPQPEPLLIETVITLWNQKTDKNGFFTIGGKLVSEAHMKIPNPCIQYRTLYSNNPLPDMTESNFIQNGNNYINAVALLYSRTPLPDIKLSHTHPYLTVTKKLQSLIKSSIVDFVVFGRRTNDERCAIFEEWLPQFVERRYLLRNYDTTTTGDMSLNRCSTETKGFLPYSFRLGTPTPSKENDCSGPAFIMEDQLIDVVDPSYSFVNPRRSTEAECTSSSLLPISSARLEQAISAALNATHVDQCDVRNPEGSSHQLVMDVANERKRKFSNNTNYADVFEWDTEEYFKEEWLDQIKIYQGDLLPIPTIQRFKSWFEYIFNSDSPAESTYRCRICHKYYDYLHMDQRYKSSLASDKGILRKSKKKNIDELTKHGLHNRAHIEIINILTSKKKKLLPDSFKEIQEKELLRQEALKITSQMIRTVYVEVKANLPMHSHRQIVLLQEAHGVQMGFHHFDKTSAQRMVSVISDTMHSTMITSIIKQNVPISIIIDGSTDVMSIPYLIIYFQTLEVNVPIVYYYALVTTTARHTADEYFNVLMNRMDEENVELSLYLKNNLVGFISDGEAVMRGEKKGLVALFRKFADHPIMAIHCMAHKLQLAIQHAFEGTSYLKTFNNNINKMYTFYYSTDSRRMQHLRETAAELGESSNLLTPVYLYAIRWIASESRALKNIHQSWHILMVDLDAISKNRDFSAAVQRDARDLRWLYLGKNYSVLFHFMFGLLNDLAWWSSQLQARLSLLINFTHFKTELTTAFENLKTNDPPSLLGFFKDAKCGSSHLSCSNYHTFYASSEVIYRGILLVADDDTVPRLETIRKKILDDLIEEMISYFPDEQFSNFDIFLPSSLPFADQESLIALYGQNEVAALCDYFKWGECDSILLEWRNLLTSIVTHGYYCRLRNGNAVEFWSKFLHPNTTNVEWTEKTKRIIQTILVIPVGSAEAERGFSIMNYIKTSRRSSLTPERLDELMRIRINGPNKIEEFSSMKYAEEWVKNHIRTDSTDNIRTKSTDLDETDETENDEAQKTITRKYLPQSTIF